MEFLASYNISVTSFLIVLLCAFLVGMSKTGFPGAGLAVVPLMAGVFGGRVSTGFLLPVLIMADIFAVWYYHRNAQWKHVVKLLPWALAGIIVATVFGSKISNELFNKTIAVLVIAGIVLMIWSDLRKGQNIPDNKWFSAFTGLTGGFATMMGNAAGPVLSLYLLSMRFPKKVFIGTGAWFFLIINVSKVPLHILYWKTINWDTFRFDLIVFPAVLAGVFSGIKLVTYIPEKVFKWLIISTTIVSAIILI